MLPTRCLLKISSFDPSNRSHCFSSSVSNNTTAPSSNDNKKKKRTDQILGEASAIFSMMQKSEISDRAPLGVLSMLAKTLLCKSHSGNERVLVGYFMRGHDHNEFIA